jgi:AcrR family transcriptional regulator
MEAIAAEAHVARTKMYRRWPDKATVMTDASCGGRSGIALPELPGTLKSLQIQTYGHRFAKRCVRRSNLEDRAPH